MQIVTDNKNNRFEELKGHLLKRKHPKRIIDYSFTKLFQPGKHENNDKNIITFTRTYNPNHQFSFKTSLIIALKTLQIENYKKHLTIRNYSLLYDNQRN